MQEFAQARDVLDKQISSTDYSWDEFQKSVDDLPERIWPMVWQAVFDELVEKRMAERNAGREEDRRAGYIVGIDPIPWLKLADTPDLRGIATEYQLRRRDELATAYERVEQRVEDYEEELQRLREEHAEIIQPDNRLWVGIGILTTFAGVGVAWPMYVMSTGPTELASVRWFIWPFCAVLAALIVYVVVYLFNLSRRQLPPIEDTTGEDRTNDRATAHSRMAR